MLDVRQQFPIFGAHPELIYLDNAATAQKPQYVLDAVQQFLTTSYANIHRGNYPLALAAEQRRREARQTVATVMNCAPEEIIFTPGATGSVNLLTTSLLRSHRLSPDDIIVLSVLEHHANIVPRQILAEQTGSRIIYLNLTPDRQYDRSGLKDVSIEHIKIVSLSLVSNVTGQIMNLSELQNITPKNFLYVLDGAQAVPHMRVDVAALGCDFFYFTGHKIGALTGSGVLYGRKQRLDQLLPGMSGGGAILEVTSEGHSYQPIPDKFEPGTPNVVGAVSLQAAFERIANLGTGATFSDQLTSGYNAVAEHEHALMHIVGDHLPELSALGIRLLGNAHLDQRIGVFTLAIPAPLSATQLGTKLGTAGICVRTGTHCTHLLHDTLASGPTLRFSTWAYTTKQDILTFFSALQKLITNS